MARNWSRRWRLETEPETSKRRREARDRQRQATEGLVGPPTSPRTATQWHFAEQGRLAPCGKATNNEATARARAAAMTREGNRWEAYRCRERACWVFGYWHLRDETKARRNRNRRRKPAQRRRRRVREELPLMIWEDDGGACPP